MQWAGKPTADATIMLHTWYSMSPNLSIGDQTLYHAFGLKGARQGSTPCTGCRSADPLSLDLFEGYPEGEPPKAKSIKLRFLCNGLGNHAIWVAADVNNLIAKLHVPMPRT